MSSRLSTRERLLEAAEQVFADKGFYEAAVDEIVQRSGTSKGSVYFHFPSKESLFLTVIEQLGNRLLQRVERDLASVVDPMARLDMALESTVRTLCRHRTLAKLLLVKGYSMGPSFASKRQEIFARFGDMTQRLMDEAMAAGGRPPDVDPRIVAYAWLGAVGEIVVRWLETGEPDPVEEALPTLRALLHGGLGLTNGQGRPVGSVEERQR